jgi:hypothetical protein
VDPHLRRFVARGDNGNYSLHYYIFSKLAYNYIIKEFICSFPCSRTAMNNLENQIDQGASYLTYIWIVALFVFLV